MSIIVIVTDPQKGGTFLSWTLHFLAGHTQYFHAKTNNFVQLPKNPNDKNNAHKFKPNQPNSYTECISYYDKLMTCNSVDFHSIYFHTFGSDRADTKKTITDMFRLADKKITLTNQSKNLLYEKSFYGRSLTPSLKNPNVLHSDNQKQFDEFIEYYFKDSLEQWKKLGLTKIWDQREFLALNYRHDAESIMLLADFSVDHFDVDCLEWFNTGELLIPDLFDYLEIKIDHTRFAQWQKIYQQWRKNHYQRLNFLWSFDKIINYIINGKYLDLKRFNLDIYQEAIIQHELIYKHNLNLKTFQLEKFTNTAHLHTLLEPNIHNLTLHQI